MSHKKSLDEVWAEMQQRRQEEIDKKAILEKEIQEKREKAQREYFHMMRIWENSAALAPSSAAAGAGGGRKSEIVDLTTVAKWRKFKIMSSTSSALAKGFSDLGTDVLGQDVWITTYLNPEYSDWVFGNVFNYEGNIVTGAIDGPRTFSGGYIDDLTYAYRPSELGAGLLSSSQAYSFSGDINSGGKVRTLNIVDLNNTYYDVAIFQEGYTTYPADTIRIDSTVLLEDTGKEIEWTIAKRLDGNPIIGDEKTIILDIFGPTLSSPTDVFTLSVVDLADNTIIEKGFIYSTSAIDVSSPNQPFTLVDVDNSVVTISGFTSSLPLTPGTSYYIRAWVTNSNRVSYFSSDILTT